MRIPETVNVGGLTHVLRHAYDNKRTLASKVRSLRKDGKSVHTTEAYVAQKRLYLVYVR